jgi:uncharacterized protein YjeT (DUF2065 family)|tara:strand:- start:74 stop:451 length:378 start_codon:yes stop_codon:yes gene_type:complete
MTDTLNIAAALLTVAFGLIALLAPAYAAGALDLTTSGSTMGYSELRASAGGLFVVVALAAIWLGSPIAYAMLGFVYAGAATGRCLSLILDNPPLGKAGGFAAIEIALAAWLIAANLPRSGDTPGL